MCLVLGYDAIVSGVIFNDVAEEDISKETVASIFMS
jgi:hypothetical protein